jgi:hypothetical protein
LSKKNSIIFVIFFLLFTGENSWAHHATVGTATGEAGPIRTISSSTLPQGKVGIDLQVEYIVLDPFSDSSLKEFASQGKDVHSSDSLFHYFIGLSYGIADNLTLGVKIPYIVLNNIRASSPEAPNELIHHGDSKGIGDLSLIGQYRFLYMKDINFMSSLIFGVKAPTGRTHVKDKRGDLFEAEHQPGSGSWDPIAGFAVSKKIGPLSLDADLLYTFATQGTQDTNLGDMLNYNLAVSYRALKKPLVLDLIAEVNGEWKQKQKVSGVPDAGENSGESTVLLSPGMRVSLNKNIMTYVSVGLPVLQHQNGKQNDTTVRTLFGIGMSF